MGKKLSKESWSSYTSSSYNDSDSSYKQTKTKTKTKTKIEYPKHDEKDNVFRSATIASDSWNNFFEAYARGGIKSYENVKAPPGAKSIVKGFMAPPQPPDEDNRQAALWRYGLLHSNASELFKDFVKDVHDQFKVDICLISFVNTNYQWFLAEEGLGCNKTGRDESFCAHAILQKTNNVFVVPDALEDWRFINNPLVQTAPFIRFYAGAPLVTPEGYKIGTLCIIDRKPRHNFSKQDRQNLSELSRDVITLMESQHNKMRTEMNTQMEQSLVTFMDEVNRSRRLAQAYSYSTASLQPLFDLATKLILSSLKLDNVFIVRISNGTTANPSVAEISSIGQTSVPVKFDADMHVRALSQRQGVIYQYSDKPTLAKSDSGEGTACGLIVPITVTSTKETGLLLNIFTRDAYRVFESHDLTYIQRFVALLSGAIQHYDVLDRHTFR